MRRFWNLISSFLSSSLKIPHLLQTGWHPHLLQILTVYFSILAPSPRWTIAIVSLQPYVSVLVHSTAVLAHLMKTAGWMVTHQLYIVVLLFFQCGWNLSSSPSGNVGPSVVHKYTSESGMGPCTQVLILMHFLDIVVVLMPEVPSNVLISTSTVRIV